MAYVVAPNAWNAHPVTLATLEHGVPGPLLRDSFPDSAAAVQLRIGIGGTLAVPVRVLRPAPYRRGGFGFIIDPTVVLTTRVEMDFGAGWVDVSEDVVSTVKASWGIRGGGPHDRVAAPGTMTFDMDNSVMNSGGARGYYSPDHASARAGFGMGTPVRLVIADTPLWVGTLDMIEPRPGVRDPRTAVQCGDWFESAARAKVADLPVQVNVQSDVLFQTLVDIVEPPPPGGTRIGGGADIYPYVLDSSPSESSRVLSEFQKLALSEYAQVYVAAGTVVFEGRRRRGSETPSKFTLHEDENLIGIAVTGRDRDQVINRIQVTAHPRRRDDTSDVVLYTMATSTQILRGETVTINCPYRDPAQLAQRVGGIDMRMPVPGTDVSFMVAKDGSGPDISAQLFVDAVFGGNSAQVTITNNGPSDGFIPPGGLRLRGRGLYDFQPTISDELAPASLEAYGENVVAYDMPYQDAPTVAQDLARFILHMYSEAETRPSAVTFVANWNDETAEALVARQISDRIRVTVPSIGLDAVFFINGVSLEVRTHGVVLVTWALAPTDPTTYWQLGIEGRSELGDTTRLGYNFFGPVWQLGVAGSSELGLNTWLN